MLTWNINPLFLDLGILQIRYYGLCFLVAILGGYFLWRRQILRSDRTSDCARRFLLLGLLGVLIGGRVGHLLFYDIQTLLNNPLEIFYFWTGGLASHGSSAGLLLALLLFSRQQKIQFIDVADRLTFSCAWGAAWVRIGNFFNSEIVGSVTALPFGVKFPLYDFRLPPEAVPLRHPTQIYEAVMAFAVLIALIMIDRRRGGERRPLGLLTCTLLALLFSGRFLIEYTKQYPSAQTHNLLTTGQWLSLPFMAVGIMGLINLYLRNLNYRSSIQK
ncbi:MAG: prolipoprotein diacylglyceryl transferase [Desulfuromonadaceae bacterium]|nr:prolipoprotein diacylglyceryl transferase [Desulfuromonadaceae bacterium]MDD2856512.1 prolipoprotein diacylglyceryl transferase [Desulfuromonadaceae bacterium]